MAHRDCVTRNQKQRLQLISVPARYLDAYGTRKTALEDRGQAGYLMF